MGNNPIWSFYDCFRTIRLNVRYYQARLHKLERLSLIFDLTLRIAAPSSAVAGWVLWKTSWGKAVWGVIVMVASIVALIEPVYKFNPRMKKLEITLFGYRQIEFELRQIKLSIENDGKYDHVKQNEFKNVLELHKKIITDNPEKKEYKKLKKKCFDEVNIELPVNSFFIPNEENKS